MSTQYTPGPWEAFVGTDLRYRVTPQRPMRPAVICEMIRIESDSEYPNDAVLSNARLISAAPDMLAALLLIQANAGESPESPEWIRSRIAAAITKATGA